MSVRELVAKYVDRCPAIAAVGNTPLVRCDLLREESPDVEVYD